MKKYIKDVVINDIFFAIDNDNLIHELIVINIVPNIYDNKYSITLKNDKDKIYIHTIVDDNISCFYREIVNQTESGLIYKHYKIFINKQDAYHTIINMKHNLYKSIQQIHNM